MGKRRSTISVNRLVEIVNERNRLSIGATQGARRGWNSLLERVLFDTGNYAGFGYLDSKDVPVGEAPGISPDYGYLDFDKRTYPDETRRMYYTKPGRKGRTGKSHYSLEPEGSFEETYPKAWTVMASDLNKGSLRARDNLPPLENSEQFPRSRAAAAAAAKKKGETP